MGFNRLVPVVGKHVDGRTDVLIIPEWNATPGRWRIQSSHNASIWGEVRLGQQVGKSKFLEDLNRLFSGDVGLVLLLRNRRWR